MYKKNLFLTITILFALNIHSNAQNYFLLNSEMKRPVVFSINGHEFTIDSNYQKIPTAFPVFDTVQYISHPPYKNHILYNFQKDSSYTISWACCATLDAYPSYKIYNDSLQFWDFEKDHSKITKLLINRPRFSFSQTGKTIPNLHAWVSDYACFPRVTMVNDTIVKYGIANKCYYWSNITPIEFFTGTIDSSMFSYDKAFVEDIFADSFINYQSQAVVYVRFFDNKKYHIEFNSNTKSIRVQEE